MRRIPAFVALALAGFLTAACSSIPILTVPAFTVPVRNTLGFICYVYVDNPYEARVASATYAAEAVYETDGVIGTRIVTLRAWGRPLAPSDIGTEPACEERDASAVPLSDEIDLPEDEPRSVTVGGDAYGEAFADLAAGGDFWLGFEASGNWSVGTSEEVSFSKGRIRVGLF